MIKQAALTRYIYEPGNDKPRFEITPEGRITEWRYNSTNDLVTTIVYGDAYPADRIASDETLKGLQLVVGGQDRSKTATLDAMGALVSTTYDAKGNVSATIAFATPLHLVGQLAQDFHPAYDPAVDRVERTVYDLDNRPIVSIDALGNATGMQYDAFGNTVAMRSSARAPPQCAYRRREKKMLIVQKCGSAGPNATPARVRVPAWYRT